MIDARCLRCKGRGYCGRAFCPIIAKAQSMRSVSGRIDKDSFSGESPAPFIGRYGYPSVSVGILSTPMHVEDAWEYDAPKQWAEQDYSIPKILDFRTGLLKSTFSSHVKKPGKYIELCQEIGMASKPVDLEVELVSKPSFGTRYDSVAAPTGPAGKLKRAELTSNPRIPRAIDKAVSDTDFKARDALAELSRKGIDENQLTKLLSVGTLGVKLQRKLVPTRWSITAVDDMLASEMLKKVKHCPEHDFSVFFGSHLGNYFLVCMFPDVYSYELFEMYMPHAEWNQSSEMNYTTDYEPFNGMKGYAQNCAGGFYAARLALTEKLSSMRKQAQCLVLRVITGEYAVPLGVWVVREAMRKALSSKPLAFGSRELLLKYVQHLLNKKFGLDVSDILAKSVMLKEQKTQTKLSGFL